MQDQKEKAKARFEEVLDLDEYKDSHTKANEYLKNLK